MPTYLDDSPNIVNDIADMRRRLSILENNQTGGGPNSPTGGSSAAPAPSGSGTTVGSVPDGSITYVKLASDVPTTLDVRFVNVTGDTITGSLAVNAPMTIGTGGSPQSLVITGSLQATSTSTLANVTVSGTTSFTANNAALEIGTVGTSNSPVLNFHSSISSTAYDGRIVASGGTASAGAGTLTYTAATHVFNGTMSFAGGGVVTSVTAGNQINLTGTATAPIVNVNTAPTFSGNVVVGGTLAVTGVPTFSSAAVFSAGITTQDFITGGSGSGLGNIAASTIQGYNVLDGSLPYAKLSAGAQAVIATSNPDTQFGFLRSATASTADSNGTAIGNLSFGGTASRVTDGLAYDGVALKGTSGTTTNGVFIVTGPLYGNISNTGIADNLYPNQGYGLKPGNYKAQVFLRVSSAASSSACAVVDVVDTQGEITSMTALTVTPAMLGTTNYATVAVPFTVTATSRSTTAGQGISVRVQYQTAATVDVYVSHVIVTPAVIGQAEITTSYFRDLAITSAKINDLTAAKITTGTMTADITQSGTIRTGPDTGARVKLDSGGISAYSSAATQTVSITSAGAVTITGTINATGGTFSGTVSGGTFQGGTFQTGTGTTSVVRFDSSSIKAWNASSVNTVNIDTSGNVQITGTINATGGTFSGSITASGTITGGTIAGANITATNVISGYAITAGTLTTQSLSIASGVSDNLILNGGGEYETSAGSGVPANWLASYEQAGSGGTFVRDTGTAHSGAASMTIQLAAATDGSAIASSSIPVSAGDVMSISGWVRSAGATLTATYIRLYGGTVKDFARGATSGTFTAPILAPATTFTGATTATGTGFASLVEGNNAPALNTWYYVEATVTIPTGVTWARLGLYGWTGGGTTRSQIFDDWVVKKQLTTTTIADGIVTAQKVQAGAITAEKITVGTYGSALVINGGFEDTSNIGNVAAGWTTVSGFTRSSADYHSGSVSALLAASGSAALLSPIFGIGVGEMVSISGWAKQQTATTSLYFRLSWRNTAGSEISTSDLIAVQAVPAAWTQYSGTLTAPANTVNAQFQVYNTSGAVYVDDFVVRKVVLPGEIATGNLNASTVITAGTLGGTRVEIDGRAASAGIRLYSGSTNILNADANAGSLTLTGLISGGTVSGSAIVGATITGGKFFGVAILANALKLGFI